jgi:N-acetylglucosamine transport system substrate-binding protein
MVSRKGCATQPTKREETEMSKETGNIRMTRREFLRGMAIAGGGAALAACRAPTPEPTEPPAAEPTQPPEEAYGGPLGVEKDTIELQIRESGTHRAPAYDKMVEALDEMYPETEWNLVYDQQNWDVLRPRFIAGNPPDGAWLSVSGDPFALVDEGLLMDVTPLMEAPAYGEEGKKFKDIFLPGMLEPGQKDGKQYLVPKSLNTWGMWYSHGLLEKHGWSDAIPDSYPWKWDDFKALLKEIKDAGLKPILSGGPGNAGSFQWAFWLNFVFQAGGDEQLFAMDSLEPGAWNNEVMVTALARTQELFEEELIDPLWSSIDWADADTIVAKYEAVFKPDGQWWVAENRDKLPEDFGPGYAPIPTIPECEGSPALIEANAEPSWLVPAEAKHPRGGMEWVRLWDSKPFSVVFAEVAGDLLPIEGSGEGADWPAASAEMLEYFRQAERYYNPMHHLWYGDLMSAIQEPLFKTCMVEMSPQECAEIFEQAAEEVRQDETIPKRSRI